MPWRGSVAHACVCKCVRTRPLFLTHSVRQVNWLSASWSVSRLGFSLGIPQVFVVICFSLPMLLTAIASYRWGRWTCLCFTYGACSVQQCTNTFAATVLYAGCLVCSCTFKKGWLPFSPPAPIYPLKCMCLHCGDTHCLVLGPQILQGALARLCGSRMRLQMRAD